MVNDTVATLRNRLEGKLADTMDPDNAIDTRERAMRRLLLILVSLAALGAGRTYHRVLLADLPSSQWTHVSTVGTVIYIRHQADGDWHITLMDPPASVKAVCEIIPAIPVPVPRKGQRIRVWGIARTDRDHSWPEIHPIEGLEFVE